MLRSINILLLNSKNIISKRDNIIYAQTLFVHEYVFDNNHIIYQLELIKYPEK
jgi:hypothetical protein